MTEKTDTFIDHKMLIFFNNLNGTIGAARIHDEKRKINSNWIFHENSDVEIGVIPFNVDFSSNDLVNIQQEVFMPFEQLYELQGMQLNQFEAEDAEIEVGFGPCFDKLCLPDNIHTWRLIQDKNLFYAKTWHCNFPEQVRRYRCARRKCRNWVLWVYNV
ncbi:MAG: hypothetical protein ACRD5B_17525 [Nitrososphaeraceae archaeon]